MQVQCLPSWLQPFVVQQLKNEGMDERSYFLSPFLPHIPVLVQLHHTLPSRLGCVTHTDANPSYCLGGASPKIFKMLSECPTAPFPPTTASLVVLEQCIPVPVNVPSYEDYEGREGDALRPPRSGEETFGGCVPASLNRARCVCPSLCLLVCVNEHARRTHTAMQVRGRGWHDPL